MYIIHLRQISAHRAILSRTMRPDSSSPEPNEEQIQKRGALAEEHHFFVARVPENMELKFVEADLPDVEIIWISIESLVDKKYLYFNNLCRYHEKFIMPVIKSLN